MNKKGICLGVLVMILGISIPVYGKESSLKLQGNITGMEEQISNMGRDYLYLEEEIQRLTDDMETKVSTQSINRRHEIKSRGNIDFENETVFVTASDLFYLADEIDILENTYKCNLVDALNSINTYFRNDGSFVYDSSLNEVDTDEKKVRLSLKNITEGISNSQSVESLSQIQATDKDGNLLYYATKEAETNKDICSLTKTDTGLPAFYQAANANNLSAGTAAWVNGTLVKGNGADNDIYVEQGYREGYTQGIADGLSKANIQYTYHEHTGNSSEVGGCYGNCTGYEVVTCTCKSYAYSDYGCAYCNHAVGMHSINTYGTWCTAIVNRIPYTYIGLVCGKTTETIESATIIY